MHESRPHSQCLLLSLALRSHVKKSPGHLRPVRIPEASFDAVPGLLCISDGVAWCPVLIHNGAHMDRDHVEESDEAVLVCMHV